MIRCSSTSAAPFLKWAGGKTKLLAQILAQFRDRIETYYEPFIGGGAVFFALDREKRFRRAVIADKNPDLVTTYRVVRDRVHELIEKLSIHSAQRLSNEYFYQIRALDPSQLDSVERAARLIFLNKTCFNGLYRVNRKGQFNVPHGRYANPCVLDREGLLAASRALANVDILEQDFAAIARQARAKDAIYFDPPYVPVSATSSFTAYASSAFGIAEQERLLAIFRACLRRGVCAVLSNSDCTVTRSLYAGLDVRSVRGTRAINSVATKRGPIGELLVVGLLPPDMISRGESVKRDSRGIRHVERVKAG